MARYLTWLLLFALLAPHSQAIEEIPNLLKDWQGWVLEGEAKRLCPMADESQHTCVWPGELTLLATDKGAEFKLAVDLFAPDWLELPGGPGYWPLEVKLAGAWIPVRTLDDQPQVYLPVGRHQITGRFAWASLPRTLSVPENLGLVHLSLNGKTIDQPSFEGAGQLWLAEQQAAAEDQSDSMDLKVFRKLTDGIPLLLTSRLELQVSGAEREVVLGPWLLNGFTPRAFNSDLPAKIEPNGQLRLQIKPGQWTISMEAHSLNPKPNLTLPAASADGPSQEVWSFQAAPTLRSVQISGGASIDPTQTTMPEDWRALPAYVLEREQALVVEELFRGNPNPPRDELRLARTLWLDFAGDGLSFRDTLSGTVYSARLDLAQPYELLKADISGAPQVVTQVQPGSGGVEIRQQHLQLDAQGRLPMARQLPVSAWGTDMAAVNWNLNLPPAWSLLYASGADSAGGSWVTKWGLFDIFLLLIIVIALGKILRPWVGALAFVCLLITYQREGAALASWLNLAAVLALLPWVSGAFARWLKRYAWLSFAALMLILLNFSIAQVRYALYPQLEGSEDMVGLLIADAVEDKFAMKKKADEVAAPMSAEPLKAAGEVLSAQDLGAFPDTNLAESLQRVSGVAARKHYNLPKASQQIDPSQQTQTGTGIPKWDHNRVYLSWSGPVTAEQITSLYWAPPWLNRPGYVLAALLPWLLAFALWQASGLLRINLPPNFSGRALSLLLLTAVLGLGTVAPDTLAEETDNKSLSLRGGEPSPELLKELKTRLLKAPLCLPDCLSIESVALQVKDDAMRLEMVVHALAPVIYNLPASQTSWWPQLALLNGERASLRQADEVLQIALVPGRQTLLLQGNLSGRTALPLAFGLNINNLKTDTSGWRISGEPTSAAPSSTLQLSRAQGTSSTTDKRLAPAPMAPFVRIERKLQLGLEWAIETQVSRIAPASGPIHLEVPLIPGEAPLGVQANAQGLIPVDLAADEATFIWTSRLKIASELSLTAAEQGAWIEDWQLDVAPQWHIQAEGVPQLGNNLAPRWLPWPGEQLRIQVAKPPAVKGNNLTLQAVELAQSVGQKAQDLTLDMTLLSNQGQDFRLTLPPGAKLTGVMHDGTMLPPIMQDGRLKLPVKPGSQSFRIGWQQFQELPLRTTTPNLEFGLPARNINVSIKLPADRWILLLGGPQMGPALLFWGVLMVVLGIAWALGRSGAAHLKAHEWVLLSLGVVAQNLLILLLLAVWFAALRWRGGQLHRAGRRDKFLQLALAGLSLLALGMLLSAIPQGLLSAPDMQIRPFSYDGLKWYSDYTSGPLPNAWVVSVPMWVYRVSMLLWSLWLAFALMRWLKWGWQQLNAGGFWPADKAAETSPQP